MNNGLSAWSSTAPGPIKTLSAYLAADVSLNASNTYFDGPSLSLVPGTWILYGAVSVLDTVQSVAFTAKLWDGITVVTSGETNTHAINLTESLFIVGVVSPINTTTYKISVAGGGVTTGVLKAAAPQNGAGNNASYLIAVKIG